jgi:hypothetical protein
MSAILPPNDERIRRFLRQAGVDENSPIDPVSRDALLELLRQEDTNEETANIPTNSAEASEISPMEQNESLLPAPTSSSSEERLVQMMQQQTRMILDLHKRMDYLTELVLQNNDNKNNIQQPASREELNRQIDELFHKVQMYEQNAETTFTTTSPTNHARQSFVPHLYQVVQIFLALRRRLAPNFDAGLIVKVVFILSILFTRLGRRHIGDEDWLWHFYRLHLLVFFVVGGFLYQTGMLKVNYIFYVQEKYIHRIVWKGETLGDIEQEVNDALERYAQRMRGQRLPPRPRNEPHGTENAEDQRPEQPQPGWRDTFIGGVIEPAPRDEQDRGMHFLRDVGFFIGSFFLSIFPMWRPEALARPAVVEVNDEADDGNGLPDIAAPADVVQPAEDDEDVTEEAKTD